MAEKKPAYKDETGKFVKGVSGNPSGRPKTDPEIRDMLKASCPQAVKLLVDTLNNNDADMTLRIKIAESITDRVLGKAIQGIDATVNGEMSIIIDGTVKEWAK